MRTDDVMRVYRNLGVLQENNVTMLQKPKIPVKQGLPARNIFVYKMLQCYTGVLQFVNKTEDVTSEKEESVTIFGGVNGGEGYTENYNKLITS